MRRRAFLPLLLLLIVMVVAAGCRYDYLFLAYEVECPLDEDGHPTRCYRGKVWNLVQCTRYESSPFELLAGDYDLELDIDIPDDLVSAARANPFPRRLQFMLRGLDAEGSNAFRFRQKAWKVARATGRIEQTFTVRKDLVVPAGGELCLYVKSKGASELTHGWLMGILLERVVEEAEEG